MTMKIQTSIVIDSPASQAWQVIGAEFAHVSDWVSEVENSSLDGEPDVGKVRVCELKNHKTTSEVITQYDPQNMVVAYYANSGLPNYIAKAENKWLVQALGKNKCRVTTSPEVILKSWLLPCHFICKLGLKHKLKTYLKALKYHVEHKKFRSA